MKDSRILIVEDEQRLGEGISRIVGRYRPVKWVRSVSEGQVEFGPGARWTALIADIGLPDGSGLEVVKVARDRYPLLPVLVLTARIEPQLINRAHALRAEYLCKPAGDEELGGFLRRCIAFERVPDDRVSRMADELSVRCELTPRETDLVAAAVANLSRTDMLEEFDITENTLKSQVRQVLRKTGHESLDALARSLLRAALHGTDAESPLDESR